MSNHTIALTVNDDQTLSIARLLQTPNSYYEWRQPNTNATAGQTVPNGTSTTVNWSVQKALRGTSL